MFATHKNPCPLPEELLPEDLSVDSKSTNAPLQRPDKFRIQKFSKIFGQKAFWKKQATRKQGPYGASAQQCHGLQQTGGSCSSLGKTRKGVFSRIEKKNRFIIGWTVVLVWSSASIGLKSERMIGKFKHFPIFLMYGVSMPCLQVSNTCLYCRCCHRL